VREYLLDREPEELIYVGVRSTETGLDQVNFTLPIARTAPAGVDTPFTSDRSVSGLFSPDGDLDLVHRV